jgi:hypothetical protein
MSSSVEESKITLDSKVCRVDELLALDVSGATILSNLETGFYYGIEEIGRRIWELTSAPIVVTELCGILTKEYDVDADTCEQDVLGFLNELAAERLLLVVG